jgi:hypothetical protein
MSSHLVTLTWYLDIFKGKDLRGSKKMGRQPCCDKVGLKRGPWTIEEDHKLVNFILNNGIQCWRMVPKLAGKYFN